MAGELLLALAALAGRMVVDATVGDERETAQHEYAQLLGRGNPKLTWLAERRLKETRKQLTGAAMADAGLIRTALAVGWAEWLVDLLGENPDAKAELQALIREIQAVPPAKTPSVPDHAASSNGDSTIEAAEAPVPQHTASTNDHATTEAAEAPGPEHPGTFGDTTIDAADAPGPEHPGTLAKRSELAFSIGQAGDAVTARDQFAALLRVREHVFGADFPDTLVARFNLAYWTGRAGDAAAARDQFAALLPVRERISGPDHSDALAVREELAYWTGCAGDAAAARDQFAALLPVRERVLGLEHAETLAVWYQLAHWTARAEDAATARE
jgi:hypothetical protein